MRRFTHLFTELDETNRTNEKVAALEAYFREADPHDAAWALYFLCGRKLPRAVKSASLLAWAAEEAGLPEWLVAECYETVGDLAETAALLLPETVSQLSLSLHEVIEKRLRPMREMTEPARKEMLARTWRELSSKERLVWNKLITGGFRVGVARTLVVRALAKAAGIEQSIMAHRVMGRWEPEASDYLKIIGEGETGGGAFAKPYPFHLASPLEGAPSALGEIAEWQVEWKWDGIRAQLIRREGEALIWSRGDELVTESFPEIAEAGMALKDGTVLDGEILAWEGDRPRPFAHLQRRLNRKSASGRMRLEFPVVFLAYDLLENEGGDFRSRPLMERRGRLEKLLKDAESRPVASVNRAGLEMPELFPREPEPPSIFPLRLSEVLQPDSWESLVKMQSESRARQVEGLMLKRRSSAYGVGRQRGDWWKWKIDPLVMDAVLIQAQLGHGRRAGLYTDYTFGIWHEGALVPVAKAYSGLNDAEIREVDAFVRANTTDRFGPVRVVKPRLVFELAFEAIQESRRHKAGFAVRFPRMNRWRHDKKPEDADTLDNLKALARSVAHPGR